MNNKYLKYAGSFLHKHLITTVWVAAALFLVLSFIHIPEASPAKKAQQIEKKLHKRERILQSYVDKAMETSPEQWLEFERFPDDMVLYKYVADTLQSWANQFPISNDEVDVAPTWYRIHDLKNRSLFNTPLAFLEDSVQYVNLGPSWYIVKTFKKGEVKIIGGIEIIRLYDKENSILKNTANKHIGLDNNYTTVAPYIDNSSVIHTLDGNAAFSIISKHPLSKKERATGLQWISILLAIAALYIYQYRHNRLSSMWLTIGGLFVIQICSYFILKNIPAGGVLFSPILYADSFLFDSLGKLMMTNIFLFLMYSSIFLSRKALMANIIVSSPKIGKLKWWALTIAAALLLVYIAGSLISLVLNSTISLDLYRINAIDRYTIIIYICYALLFTALLFLLYIILSIASPKFRRYVKKHTTEVSLYYTFGVSIAMLLLISYGSFKKEEDEIKVMCSRIATERNLGLEIQLQTIEKNILADPLIRAFIGNPYSETMILNRLVERYLWNILPNYQISVSICAPLDIIRTSEYVRPVHCFSYFSNKIREYGVPLSNSSAFYYLDYFNADIDYLGAFNIIKGNSRYDMYIDIQSKRSTENAGYPYALLNDVPPVNRYAKYPYSIAKYQQGKLTVHNGQYNFPVSIDTGEYGTGFSFHTIKNDILFMYKLPNSNMVVITRPSRNIFLHLLSFSYTFLFFSLIFLCLPRMFRTKWKEPLLNVPKKSFRRKMIVFPTVSLVIALIFMAISSITLIIEYTNNSRMTMMEEKLLSVQNTFSQTSRTSERFTEINSSETFNAMDLVSKNARVDINLFDPFGKLIRTTQPEIFNEYIAYSRMNPKAYYELVYNKRMQVIQEEQISSMKYYSLYTPIYNDKGTLLAIANIPFFVSDTILQHDTSTIIAGVINIYIILIIAAILIAIFLSNSVTKPLKEISSKMESMDINHTVEHINYKANDELGMLVKTYNKMIDDLEKSAKELAQSEREGAWREMARQIAHEIKNPLTPMKLSIQHLKRMKSLNVPDWQERFDTVSSSLIEQIDILSDTASEFSSFAKFYNEDISDVDLIALLYEQSVLFDNYENIRITYRHSNEKAVVQTRKGQITRAFVNLLTNAIQAIEQKSEGQIVISVYKEGKWFRTDIEDNGNGVSEENLKNLFNPNFTTKTKGSGLGLAISRSIVSQSHGEIFYSKSAELGGACFSIRMPRCVKHSEDLT